MAKQFEKILDLLVAANGEVLTPESIVATRLSSYIWDIRNKTNVAVETLKTGRTVTGYRVADGTVAPPKSVAPVAKKKVAKKKVVSPKAPALGDLLEKVVSSELPTPATQAVAPVVAPLMKVSSVGYSAVPSKHANFVPFGDFADLKKIIDSVFSTRHSSPECLGMVRPSQSSKLLLALIVNSFASISRSRPTRTIFSVGFGWSMVRLDGSMVQ